MPQGITQCLGFSQPASGGRHGLRLASGLTGLLQARRHHVDGIGGGCDALCTLSHRQVDRIEQLINTRSRTGFTCGA